MVLLLRVWIVLLSAITTHGAIKQYDMGEICGRTVSMSDDGIYGFEALMYMTSQLSGTGRCHLTFEKRSDYDYLHFYFSAVDLPDCNTMSLYINEGDTVQSTVAHADIPRMCGPMAASIVNDHYSSSRRYFALEFTWNPNSTFRGSVFRLVANSYTCDETCGSGQDKCDDGPCIYAYLDTTSGRDFCGGQLTCTADVSSTEDTEDVTIAIGGVIGTIVTVIFVGITVCTMCYILRKFCSDSGCHLGRLAGDACECLCGACSSCKRGCERGCECCCDCCGDACQSCKEGCEQCCECTGQKLTNTKQRVTEYWDDFSCPVCAGGDQPVVTAPPPATAMTEVATNTDTVTVDNETVANTNYNASSYSDSDGEYPDDFESESDNSSIGGGATEDPSAPPPSYTAVMRARPLPSAPSAPPLDTPTEPDPPSYDAAVDNPAFEPPEYDMVMANKTFYGAKK